MGMTSWSEAGWGAKPEDVLVEGRRGEYRGSGAQQPELASLSPLTAA